MSIVRTAYETATTLAQPILGVLVRRRVRRGKEVAGREGERFGRASLPRPAGRLIWLHGASIGETRLLLELAREVRTRLPDTCFLLTSQTVTAAKLIDRAIEGDESLAGRTFHQFAPLDAPAIAKRFLNHWVPDAAIFAEGEIWPNLLKQLKKSGIPTALVNARMTDKSIDGWRRWQKLSKSIFGTFDIILAADARTASGLERMLGKPVPNPGNLKAALPPPGHDAAEEEHLKRGFIGARQCLVAVSTHEGEEDFLLNARAQMDRKPATIIIPRHPERAATIVNRLKQRGVSHVRRSMGESPELDTDVLLADTLGEVGLFVRLADTVYLGGGHAPGIGGHNPIEILRLGKPLATGPDVFNFDDAKAQLSGQRGYNIVETPEQLVAGFPYEPPEDSLIHDLESKARTPMDETLNALMPVLKGRKPE